MGNNNFDLFTRLIDTLDEISGALEGIQMTLSDIGDAVNRISDNKNGKENDT